MIVTHDLDLRCVNPEDQTRRAWLQVESSKKFFSNFFFLWRVSLMWCVRQGRGWIRDKFLGLFWRTCFGLRSHVLGLEWICLFVFSSSFPGMKGFYFRVHQRWCRLMISKPCPFPTLTHTHTFGSGRRVYSSLFAPSVNSEYPQAGPEFLESTRV